MKLTSGIHSCDANWEASYLQKYSILSSCILLPFGHRKVSVQKVKYQF